MIHIAYAVSQQDSLNLARLRRNNMVNIKTSRLSAFRHDRLGNITIMSALMMPGLIGIGALVLDFGYGLLTRIEHQRVADLAAYAGAVAYSASNSTATMNAANVAALNGLSSSAVSGSLVASPRTNTNQAVSVTVTTSETTLLAPVLASGSSLSVSASAFAEISAQSPACILALSGSSTGVQHIGQRHDR